MSKRKASADTLSNGDSPQRRRTRSIGPLLDTQPVFSRSKTRTPKRSIAVEPAVTRSETDFHETSSLKENEAEGTEDVDELNLSPSKRRRGRPPRRVVMDSVEITTPAKRRPTMSSQNDAISPASPMLRSSIVREAVSMPQQLPVTPSKKRTAASPKPSMADIEPSNLTTPVSHTRLPRVLPPHLHPCLNAQKRAILAALQSPPNFSVAGEEDDDPLTNTIASQQLSDLLTGTVSRGEGNSCLVLGPRGSGKTRVSHKCSQSSGHSLTAVVQLVEHAISTLPDHPIVIHLSGWAQLNDRLAMREVARQLTQQTGRSFLSDSEADELDADDNVDNPFVDSCTAVSLPPPSHLPALISVLPTLPRPTIVVLDAFDNFTLHARQSLLYCLLDTVQSCRVSNGNKGVAVIGVTTRVDTINLLEKRVKSRFSGRILRTAAPSSVDTWIDAARKLLSPAIRDQHEEWLTMWTTSVDKFLADPKVLKIFQETFALFKDAGVLRQMMVRSYTFMLPFGP